VYVNYPSPTTVKSYAECLANASGATIAQRGGGGALPPGDEETRPACSTGELAVGGGFVDQAGVEINGIGHFSSTVWDFEIVNHGTASATVYTFVECLNYAGAHISQDTYQSSSITAGGTGSAAAACPSGTYVSGGGYRYQPQAFVYAMLAGGSGTKWVVSLYANGGADKTLYPSAICLGF
jgi:hypothetical protein